MLTVQLTEEEWQRVLAFMSYAAWKDVNALLLKMGEQLQKQSAVIKHSNSGEMPENIGEMGVKQ